MRGTTRARIDGSGAGKRGTARSVLGAACLLVAVFTTAACGGDRVDVEGGGSKTAASVRAERRAFDGAPPVVAHENFGMTCIECHNLRGMEVPEVGFAPPSPHEITAGMSSTSRCVQCHVFQQTDDVFVANAFVALRQDLRHGQRLNALSPPVMPHKLLMRENCSACHTGLAAREEIRTSHPERVRCGQCHVPQRSRAVFTSDLGGGSK